MREWTHAEHAEAVGVEVTRMAGIVRGRDMSAPVGTCPGWDLAELVAHVGGAHRWAAAMVRDLTERPYGAAEIEMGLPSDVNDRPDWLDDGGALLSGILLSRQAEAPMWSWAQDRRVRFWSRRMLHETVVHRVDAELALGVPVVVGEEVAADGVQEFLDLLPHVPWQPGVAELRGDGETISLQADTGAGWVITLDPDRFHHRRSVRPGDATVRAATSADLLQVLWGRRGADDYAVEGDVALLTRWRELTRI